MENKDQQIILGMKTDFGESQVVFYLRTKIEQMETIVINVENKSKAKRILGAIKLLNGVTNASIANEEDLENISILKACEAARKTPKATKEDVLNALR